MGNGHIFVIRGDLTKLACNAWLIPTDEWFTVEEPWRSASDHEALARVKAQGWPSGERVLPLTAEHAPTPAVWLANIGASEQDGKWYADAAAEFVRKSARDAEPTAPGGRPPLLAINHLGTDKGGAKQTKGDVLQALFDTLLQVLAEDDIAADIVVVSWDAAAHAAAQRARLHALTRDNADERRLDQVVARWPFADAARAERLRAAASDLAGRARRNQLSVFMGAGVSAGAGLPGWSGLLARLGEELGDTTSEQSTTNADLELLKDPRDQAALLERRYAKAGKSLAVALAAKLASSRYSLLHGLLSSLPVTEFITTNFDELFEAAATTSQRTLRVIGGGPSADNGSSDRWLLKLHGSVSDASTIVLTRSSYIEAPRHRGALFGLVQAMLMTRHMLFVGYGLADEDFHELVHEVRTARAPAPGSAHDAADPEAATPTLGTAITLFDQPVHAEIWSGDVDVVAMCSARSDAQFGEATAAREVELFLDLVGLLAADRAAFVLDKEYEDMLDASEADLETALACITIPTDADDHEGWRMLRELLVRLGRTDLAGD